VNSFQLHPSLGTHPREGWSRCSTRTPGAAPWADGLSPPASPPPFPSPTSFALLELRQERSRGKEDRKRELVSLRLPRTRPRPLKSPDRAVPARFARFVCCWPSLGKSRKKQNPPSSETEVKRIHRRQLAAPLQESAGTKSVLGEKVSRARGQAAQVGGGDTSDGG
jgi:hypothetical protein